MVQEQVKWISQVPFLTHKSDREAEAMPRKGDWNNWLKYSSHVDHIRVHKLFNHWAVIFGKLNE